MSESKVSCATAQQTGYVCVCVRARLFSFWQVTAKGRCISPSPMWPGRTSQSTDSHDILNGVSITSPKTQRLTNQDQGQQSHKYNILHGKFSGTSGLGARMRGKCRHFRSETLQGTSGGSLICGFCFSSESVPASPLLLLAVKIAFQTGTMWKKTPPPPLPES